jgi:hypothetical protein
MRPRRPCTASPPWTAPRRPRSFDRPGAGAPVRRTRRPRRGGLGRVCRPVGGRGPAVHRQELRRQHLGPAASAGLPAELDPPGRLDARHRPFPEAGRPGGPEPDRLSRGRGTRRPLRCGPAGTAGGQAPTAPGGRHGRDHRGDPRPARAYAQRLFDACDTGAGDQEMRGPFRRPEASTTSRSPPRKGIPACPSPRPRAARTVAMRPCLEEP